MANVNAPFGFRPVGKMGSDINNNGTNVYPIADNYATSIFKGDVVQLVDGVIEVGTATSTKNIGIFNGVFISKDPSTGKPKWSNFYSQTNVATGETIEAYVYDDPNQLFEVQMGGTATLAAAALGNNIDSVAGSGSTINGQSTSTLATAITGSGATAQFRVIRASQDPENSDTGSSHCNYIVKFNEHLYLTTTGSSA